MTGQAEPGSDVAYNQLGVMRRFGMMATDANDLAILEIHGRRQQRRGVKLAVALYLGEQVIDICWMTSV